MENNQKGFVIPLVIAIVAILVVGVGGYYFASKAGYIPDNTPSDIIQPFGSSTPNGIIDNLTKDWKTYTSNKFNYTFKYPSDWSIWEMNPIIGLVSIFPNSKSEEVRNKTISTSDKITFSVVYSLGSNLKGEDVKIGELTWISVLTSDTPTDGGSEKLLAYIGPSTNGYITVDTGIHNKEIVLQILSTFKFIDNNVVGGDKDEQSTTTPVFTCKSDLDCREISCPVGGGFAHEICSKGECTISAEVRARCTATTTKPIACTMDAMMCPDGTYVGRSGPDCKFVCPNN